MEKETCAICGGKAGWTGDSLRTGERICSKCKMKLPGFIKKPKKFTLEEAQKIVGEKEEKEKEGAIRGVIGKINQKANKAADDNLRESGEGVAEKEIIVTTGDLREDYEIIGPVFFQVSNKGLFSSALSRLVKKYKAKMEQKKKDGQLSERRMDWGIFYGEWSFGMENDFDKAFFVAIEELKERARILEGDAVIFIRQDIDLDTTDFQFFYLQAYGTVVRFRLAEDEGESRHKHEL